MTLRPDTPEPARLADQAKLSLHVLSTATLYFAMVFTAGLVLGPMRVLWLEPVLGKAIAVLCETPFLIAAMAFAGRYAPQWCRLRGGWLSHVAVGLIALTLQQVADLAVGFGLRGMTLTDQRDFFTTPPGYIYLANLFVFALAPLLARKRPSEPR